MLIKSKKIVKIQNDCLTNKNFIKISVNSIQNENKESELTHEVSKNESFNHSQLYKFENKKTKFNDIYSSNNSNKSILNSSNLKNTNKNSKIMIKPNQTIQNQTINPEQTNLTKNQKKLNSSKNNIFENKLTNNMSRNSHTINKNEKMEFEFKVKINKPNINYNLSSIYSLLSVIIF